MEVKAKEVKEQVESILQKYQHDQSMLVSVLQDVQEVYRYLPREALDCVCEGLDIPLSRVYSVATFFKAFSLTPRGRHLIHVCLGTACHVRGAAKIRDKIERDLCICSGETTEDLKFTLETVNCVGSCALGPIVIVDGEYSGEMTVEKVKPLIKRYG